MDAQEPLALKQCLDIWASTMEHMVTAQRELLDTVASLTGDISEDLNEQCTATRQKLDEIRQKITEEMPRQIQQIAERRDDVTGRMLDSVVAQAREEHQRLADSVRAITDGVHDIQRGLGLYVDETRRERAAAQLRETKNSNRLQLIGYVTMIVAAAIGTLPTLYDHVLAFLRRYGW